MATLWGSNLISINLSIDTHCFIGSIRTIGYLQRTQTKMSHHIRCIWWIGSEKCGMYLIAQLAKCDAITIHTTKFTGRTCRWKFRFHGNMIRTRIFVFSFRVTCHHYLFAVTKIGWCHTQNNKKNLFQWKEAAVTATVRNKRWTNSPRLFDNGTVMPDASPWISSSSSSSVLALLIVVSLTWFASKIIDLSASPTLLSILKLLLLSAEL